MQMNLIHETIADAALEVIHAAGGFKVVGQRLFPELAPDHAGNKLRACLDDDRREKFSPQQIVLLLRIGREFNCHALMNHISSDAGYSNPQPVEPEDEIARLQIKFIETAKEMRNMASRIETITATAAMRRVA